VGSEVEVLRNRTEPDTEREISASFERESGATQDGRDVSGELGANNRPARRAKFSRGVDRWNGMWRDGVSPVSSAAQTNSVKTAIVCWATAESSASGCGAERDRMASVHKSKLVSKLLAALDQGLGL
jgi:hypothetical protein